MPEPNLRERNATKVLADGPVMNRVVEAVSTATGLSYLDALDAYQNRLEALGPEATVEKVLGTDADQVLPLVKLLEGHGERIHRTLDAAPPNAPEGERITGDEQVLLPADAEQRVEFHAKLADPIERARRLARARAVDGLGTYAGADGAERFHNEDDTAAEQGYDLVRTQERAGEVKAARERARAEAARLQAPLTQMQALRQEKANAGAEVRRLDNALEQAEAQYAQRPGGEVKRRIGLILGERRELTKRLEQIDADLRLLLDSIPAVRPAERSSDGLGIREKARKMQLEIDAASAYCHQHPETSFLKALEMAEQGEIRLSDEALLDRRARRYLLDHNMGTDRFEEALAAVRELEE